MTKRFKEIPVIFWISTVIVLILVCIAINPSLNFKSIVDNINELIYDRFGYYYLFLLAGSLVICIILLISPLGKIRLGGADAKPDHSVISWLGMLFTAGMGTGMVFWGAAEPLYHYMNPPIQSGNNLTNSLCFTFFHWGLHPWSIYALTAIIIGFLGFNLNRGFTYSKLFHINLTNRVLKQSITFLIDFVAIIAVFFGVSSAFGMGILLVESGLKTVFHFNSTPIYTILLIIVITACYMISSFRGLNKGIKVLANISVVLSLISLAAVFILSAKDGLLTSIVKSTYLYVVNIPSMSFGLMEYTRDSWLRNWTLSYWSWWIAWAPFVGSFIAIVSKGRTLREMTLGILFVPTIFSILWFTIFGEAAINMQQANHIYGDTFSLDKSSIVLFNLLDYLSHNNFLIILSLLLVTIFFINSADSATYTLASISTSVKEGEVPSKFIQLLWGLMFSILAGLFVLCGGINMLRQVTLITVLPFAILLLIIFIYCCFEAARYRSGE